MSTNFKTKDQSDLQAKLKGTVVFFSIDALGHIHPILSIARELIDRNYRAIVLTIRKLSLASKYEELGLEFQHCEEVNEFAPSAKDSEQMHRNVMEPLIANFRKGPRFAFEATYSLDGACGQHVRNVIEKHDLIEAKLKSLNPDLIIIDYIVGVPCATSVAKKWARLYSGFPSILYSARNNNFVAGLGLARGEMTPEMKKFEIETKRSLRLEISDFFKLKDLADWEERVEIAPSSPFLNFYLGPEELSLDNSIPPLNPLKETWFRLEHTITEDPKEALNRFKIPEKLLKLPGKLVYFSLGTLVTSDVKLINRLLSILSESPNRFIVSKGQRYEEIDDHPNIWGAKFLDQKSILPQVDLFITHGGHNSIIEAFYYGVPALLVLPVFADQFDCAQRVHECKLGLRLNPFTCTKEELLSSIDDLLLNEKLASKMKNIGSRLRSIQYHKIAVDKIENLMNS